MNREKRMREYLEGLLLELVDRPEELRVDAQMSGDDQVVVFTVRTADGEVGKVIGKQGRNVQAVRVLLEAVASKYRLRAVLEIAETDGPRRRREHVYT